MPSETDLERIKQILDTVEGNIRQIKNLLFSKDIAQKAASLNSDDGKVIEGIFDGERMVGPRGKTYDVPANYASKSKLVTGDTLKLTISADGTFLYKQIGPVERKKMVGTLREVSPKHFFVECGEQNFQVLPASITYFKAEDGDKLTILVPKDAPAQWAAVENLIETTERGKDAN